MSRAACSPVVAPSPCSLRRRFALWWGVVAVQAVSQAASTRLEVLPSEGFTQRWCDCADHPYAASFRERYDYHQAEVEVRYDDDATELHCHLSAARLKPNFAYQVKLVGADGTPSSERLGLCGRWWQEEWDGGQWSNGCNLNDKGDGSRPNPNDRLYYARRDVPQPTSPTRRQYRYRGYLVAAGLLTDATGRATLDFNADRSFHVLWRESQRPREEADGASTHWRVVAGEPPSAAYDAPVAAEEVAVYGEWERLPLGGVRLPPGNYDAVLALAEESFHGAGGEWAGQWATVLGGRMVFRIRAEEPREVRRSPAPVVLRWDLVEGLVRWATGRTRRW